MECVGPVTILDRSAAICEGHQVAGSLAMEVRIGASGNISASWASTRSPPRGSMNQWCAIAKRMLLRAAGRRSSRSDSGFLAPRIVCGIVT